MKKAVVLFLGILLAAFFATASAEFSRDNGNIQTMGSYFLDLPEQGIECSLTYVRYDYTQYIGPYRNECPMVYDLPVLSGNLPGIKSINEQLEQDFQNYLDEIFGEYGFQGSREYADEYPDAMYVSTNMIQQPIYCSDGEKTSGLQYYDGRYVSLLFVEEYGDEDRTHSRIDAATFDLQTGERLGLNDLFGVAPGFRQKLANEVENYLLFEMGESENEAREIRTQMERVDLNDIPYSMSEDGRLFVYLDGDGAISSDGFFRALIQTNISLDEALSAVPKQEHEKKTIRLKQAYSVESSGKKLIERWDYDQDGRVVMDITYGSDDRARATHYDYDDNGRLICETKETSQYEEKTITEYDTNGKLAGRAVYHDDFLYEETKYVLIGNTYERAFYAIYQYDGSGFMRFDEYDSQGNVMKTTYKDIHSDGTEDVSESIYDYQYEYDEYGNTVRKYCDGVLDHTWRYDYSEDGIIIWKQRYSYTENGTEYVDREYTYSPDGVLLVENQYVYDSFDEFQYQTKLSEYYENGKKKRETRYNADGSVSSDYQYNQNGDLVYVVEQSGGLFEWYEYNTEGKLVHIRTENDAFYNKEEDERYWMYADTMYAYNCNGDVISKSVDGSQYTYGGVHTEYTYEYWGDDAERDNNVAGIPIDEAHFPDDEFRYYIQYMGFDMNSDGFLSDGEIAAVDYIEMVPNNETIESLEGIQYFTRLTDLIVNGKDFAVLDVSELSMLHRLECDDNGIQELILGSHPDLVYLNCSSNPLTVLDISGCEELIWLAENGTRYEDDERIDYVVENRAPSMYGEEGLSLDAGVVLITEASPAEEGETDRANEYDLPGKTNDYAKAYHDLLTRYGTEIQQNEDNAPGNGSGSVALVDFFGDETPELLFATYYEEGDRPCTIFHAYTMDGGSPRELTLTSAYYAQDFVSHGTAAGDGVIMWENMSVYLFICEMDGRQCLGAYYSVGSDYLDELVTVFDRSGEELTVAHQYAHSESEWTDAYGYLNQVYSVDGVHTDLYEYGSETARVFNSAKEIVYAGYEREELQGVPQNRLFWSDAVESLEDTDDSKAISIDEEHFPDAAFRQYIFDYDTNGDGRLSAGELRRAESLYVDQDIVESFEGIQYLTGLIDFSCYDNYITSLDVSELHNLEELNCTGNQLVSLVLGDHPNLRGISCEYNEDLEQLDISGCDKLVWLVTYTVPDSDEYMVAYYGEYEGEDLWLSMDAQTQLITGTEQTWDGEEAEVIWDGEETEDYEESEDEGVVTELGYYPLDRPDQGIELTLACERHDFTTYAGSQSFECPMIYDLVQLSGNLPGIDSINALLRQDYESFKDGVYGDDGFRAYLENFDYDPPEQYIDTVKMISDDEYSQFRAGLQYYDGRYISLLYDTEWCGGGTAVEFNAHCMTFDLQTGEKMSIADLFGDSPEFRTRLANAAIQELMDSYDPIGFDDDIDTTLNNMDLSSQKYFLLADGELVLCFDEYELGEGAMGSPMVPTGIRLGDGPR